MRKVMNPSIGLLYSLRDYSEEECRKQRELNMLFFFFFITIPVLYPRI